MSISDKLTTVAENVQKVYEKGKSDEYNNFWNMYQDNGNRTNYNYAFAYVWDDESFKPKYDIVPTGYLQYEFSYSKIEDISACLERQGVIFDTSKATRIGNVFDRSEYLKKAPAIDVRSSDRLTMTYYNSPNLESVEIHNIQPNTYYDRTFSYDYNLKDLKLTGTIGARFDVSYSSKLSVESLKNILNILADYSEDTSGTEWIVTIGATNKAKLTDEELQIAWDKGWQVN